MWLHWFHKKSVLPPPLSILYVVLPMCWVIRRLFKICSPEMNTKAGRIDEQQVKFSKKIIFYIVVQTRQISSLSWYFSVQLLHLSPKKGTLYYETVPTEAAMSPCLVPQLWKDIASKRDILNKIHRLLKNYNQLIKIPPPPPNTKTNFRMSSFLTLTLNSPEYP